MAYDFSSIELKWQQYWLANKSFRALDPAEAGNMRKAYILDMFPYPSGAGLHVGHPEGWTGTDIVSRYLRMKGYNVLHPMGWDAFGLPAEQYAIKNNVHPTVTTRQNIDNFRRQIQMLGLSYDWDREVNTTDPAYYKWSQWIFLQLFNSYFDPVEKKAKPIAHLMNELLNGNLMVAPDGSVHLNPVQEGMEPVFGQASLLRNWSELSADEQRETIDGQRLAYTAEVPVNWCPGLGTVLANEEVIDGKSEVGGFPVEKRPMRQWMLRITAYADRLIDDLDSLEWPESLKEMQRNWIGKSVGAEVDFELAGESGGRVEDEERIITVFTTRPDTLYGATYMVLAPEHPLVERITTAEQRAAVESYRAACTGKSERDRMAEAKEKTGVFTGAHAINPINDEKIPIWVADYVLMGYGTGAIMAVPAHDERDFEFAKKFGLTIRAVVMPDEDWLIQQIDAAIAGRNSDEVATKNPKVHVTQIDAGVITEYHFSIDQPSKDNTEPFPMVHITEIADGVFTTRHVTAEETSKEIGKLPRSARSHWDREFLGTIYQVCAQLFGSAYTGDGVAINSEIINGLPTAEAKDRITAFLAAEGVAHRTVKYKLRDWLFSRQRYWGEPFPILLDEQGNPYALNESELPLELPPMEDFKPTGTPEPPLSKAKDWLRVERDGKVFTRETNTMPQWAGSCWYYLRYIDPKNPHRFVDPAKEKYWMPVDLYVGGVEHAVLHLLYSRFWHKVLFDLGHVSTKEPFGRLVNQGLILGEMEYHIFESADGKPVTASEAKDIDEEATPTGVRMIAVHAKTGAPLVGRRISEDEVEKTANGFRLKSNANIRVDARSFKMSKSRGNVVNPDAIVKDFGADCFRLYEMYMGPLEAQKPWNTRDIVGMSRFLNGVWRNLIGDEDIPIENRKSKIENTSVPDALDRMMHRTIKKVAEDIEALRFNTAIAELIKLNNEITGLAAVPRMLAENLTLMLAPFAPHLAEEVWRRLGHANSLIREPWPKCDEAKLVETTMELPVQVNGKLRDKIVVPAGCAEEAIFTMALASEKLKPWIEGKTIVKKLYVPGKLVNLVVK